MYVEFLNELARIATVLGNLIEDDPDKGVMPLPYVVGALCVHLDGTHVGHFYFDDYLVYTADEEKDGATCR